MATELQSIIMVIIATLVGAFGPIYLKRGSQEFSFNIFKIIKNKNLVFGILFYVLATILFIPALKGGELSILYPFVALTYVWVSLLSVKMLGEKMNMLKWIGIVLIIVGVSFIGFGA